MRVMFVAPPFVAHINPMSSISRVMHQRGHQVAWVTYEERKNLLPPEAEFFPASENQDYRTAIEGAGMHGSRFLAEQFVFFYRDAMVPLSHMMLPDIEAAIASFKPDVLVVDQHALAGGIAARRHNLPWVTSAPSAQLLTNFDAFPKGKAWLVDMLSELQTQAGLDPVEDPDLSPNGVLLYTTTALAGENEVWPSNYIFVGPSISQRVDEVSFPFEDLAPMRRLLVSLGSLVGEGGSGFMQVVVEALRDQEIQVIVSDPAGVIENPPSNFIVKRWLPQLQLLPLVDGAITHGGSTVNEALSFGVPLIVAPVWTDNFVYANKVVDAGAGVRVKFSRISAETLRREVFRVLDTASFREAAQRVGDSFAKAGGTDAAASAVEAVLENQKLLDPA